MIVTHEFSQAQTAPAAEPSNDNNDAAVEGSLPIQPVVSSESLAVAYVIVLNSLAETLFEHTGPAAGDPDSKATAHRRSEVCAAVWAAIRAALEASTLSAEERARMLNLVWQRLLFRWQEFCGSNGVTSEWVEKRTDEYLHEHERAAPVVAASHIVKTLLKAIGVPDRGRSVQSRVLSSLVGHRIESDAHHFNELKSRYRFV
jgi:hypothetical protein